MGAFIRKRRPEETVNPEYFYARFDEEWEVIKVSEGCVLDWGYLVRFVCWDSSQHPFVFRDKDAPFFWL